MILHIFSPIDSIGNIGNAIDWRSYDTVHMQVSNQAEHTVRSNDSAASHVSNTKTNKETRDPQAVQFELSLLITLHVRSYATTFAHGTERKVYKDHYSFNVFRIDLIRISIFSEAIAVFCRIMLNDFSGIMAKVSLGGRLFYSSSASLMMLQE